MESVRLLLSNRHLQDLNPLIAGEQVCPPGHRYGPHIRRYTLLHYVVSGKGTFYARGGAYPVRAGQAFLILPEEVTTYEADARDPWHYRWVGFDGSLSRRFSELAPVFDVPQALFPVIFPQAPDEAASEYRIAGELFSLYARLFPENTGANLHVQKVKSLIRATYMQELRVESIAREMNLDRRYLTRLFKEKTGFSVQEYLIRVRMSEAERCLEQGFSVSETARLCGYESACNFSRMYKKYHGQSPTYRTGHAQPDKE